MIPAKTRLWNKSAAGACGLKLHEDWGSTPATSTLLCLWQTRLILKWRFILDTLNECGFVDDTIEAYFR